MICRWCWRGRGNPVLCDDCENEAAKIEARRLSKNQLYAAADEQQQRVSVVDLQPLKPGDLERAGVRTRRQ